MVQRSRCAENYTLPTAMEIIMTAFGGLETTRRVLLTCVSKYLYRPYTMAQGLVTNNPIVASNWARKTPFTCVSNVLWLLLLPESAEFTRTAAGVWGWSEGQTDKLISCSLWWRQRDSEFHQESWNPGSGVTQNSFAARTFRLSGQ